MAETIGEVVIVSLIAIICLGVLLLLFGIEHKEAEVGIKTYVTNPNLTQIQYAVPKISVDCYNSPYNYNVRIENLKLQNKVKDEVDVLPILTFKEINVPGDVFRLSDNYNELNLNFQVISAVPPVKKISSPGGHGSFDDDLREGESIMFDTNPRFLFNLMSAKWEHLIILGKETPFRTCFATVVVKCGSGNDFSSTMFYFSDCSPEKKCKRSEFLCNGDIKMEVSEIDCNNKIIKASIDVSAKNENRNEKIAIGEEMRLTLFKYDECVKNNKNLEVRDIVNKCTNSLLSSDVLVADPVC